MCKKSRKIKKMLSLAVSIVLICIASVQIPFSAATIDESKRTEIVHMQAIYETYKDVCDRVAQAMLDREETLDVSEYQVPKEDAKYIIRIAVRKNPEIFYYVNIN